MEKKEYLNEEKYQNTSKKLFLTGVGIITFGLVITLIIIITNIDFGPKVSKEELQQQLAQLKPTLENRYNELESKGFDESWDYKDEEGYEMHLIDTALDPHYKKCEFSSRYTDNDTTREYCKIKAQIYEFDNPKNDGGIFFNISQSLMILLPCLGFGLMLIITAKRREIAAYSVQQVMPITKEGMEKMTPTISNALGNIGKEIAKGVKEGLKEEEEKK